MLTKTPCILQRRFMLFPIRLIIPNVDITSTFFLLLTCYVHLWVTFTQFTSICIYLSLRKRLKLFLHSPSFDFSFPFSLFSRDVSWLDLFLWRTFHLNNFLPKHWSYRSLFEVHLCVPHKTTNVSLYIFLVTKYLVGQPLWFVFPVCS